ncbi:response regulator [Dactylosporangium sp. NPDC049525]|uniref:hybrid sensor histidine kinase/response regulator n=1 Tax=Dactylosporangium sp. NPDC049525 TaxID=3154730 RepID=UPI00344AFFB7
MDAMQLLLVEDSEDDAILVVKRLRRAGLTIDYRRVETPEAMAAELDRSPPDLVISDNSMPRFNAEAALALLRQTGLDIPFIVVSGQIGEESAAALMRAGAQDFVLKDSLSRLAPAAHRELRDARERHERRQAQAALHTAEERFRLIAEHLSDVVVKYRLTPVPRVEYVSPGIVELNGHHPGVLYARPELIFDAVHPDDLEQERRAWLAPPPQPFLTRWRRPNGTEAWIEHRLVAVHPGDGAPVAVEGILRDVTTQIEAAHEREELARQLHQAERLDSLGQLAGGIAHDFNNLLHVISGYADFILDELGPEHPCSRDADAIADAARRGAALTRQLLIFTRLQPSHPQLVNINAVIADVERLLRRTIGEDIDFVIRPDPTISCVTIDPSRLEQLIMNLVVNARAAMPSGGELTISTAAVDGRFVRVTVTDTGCGMTPEVQRRAFEPFFTTKGAGNGSGLGLATVYGVVREAAGTITLFSEPGRGTRFTIDLPATDQPVTVLPYVPVATATSDGEDEHILLIEDDPRVRETTRRLLQGHRYQVTDVPTRDDALEVIRDEHQQVDLCLSDIVMPGMPAPEFIEQLRAQRPATPIVFMSGYPAEHHNSRNLPDDIPIVTKPAEAATLLRTIRAAIDRTSTGTDAATPGLRLPTMYAG